MRESCCCCYCAAAGGVKREVGSAARSAGEGERVEGGAGRLRCAASFTGAWRVRGVRAVARSGECAASGAARGNGRGSALRQAGRVGWAEAKVRARRGALGRLRLMGQK